MYACGTKPELSDPRSHDTLEEVRKRHLVRVIASLRPHTGWDEIATVLGISKKTLWQYRKDYGITIP